MCVCVLEAGNPGSSQLIYISGDKCLVTENPGMYVKFKLQLQYIITIYIIVLLSTHSHDPC